MGTNRWVVTVERDDGSLVVFDGASVAEYLSAEEFENGRKLADVELSVIPPEDLWVLVDSKGNIHFDNDELGRGWRHEEDAEREARALTSQTGKRYLVSKFQDVE